MSETNKPGRRKKQLAEDHMKVHSVILFLMEVSVNENILESISCTRFWLEIKPNRICTFLLLVSHVCNNQILYMPWWRLFTSYINTQTQPTQVGRKRLPNLHEEHAGLVDAHTWQTAWVGPRVLKLGLTARSVLVLGPDYQHPFINWIGVATDVA